MLGRVRSAVGTAWAAVYDLQNRASEDTFLGKARTELLADVNGLVLEIGAGTGANVPHYPRGRDLKVIAIDPDAAMLARARKRDLNGLDIDFRLGSAYPLDFADRTFDYIVVTFALCTIPQPERALAEARRVLKDEGRLLFIEHVRADDHPTIARWQGRLAPAWKIIADGCRLNQDTRTLIESSGFRFEQFQRRYETDVWLPIMRAGIGGVAVKV